MLCDGKFPFNLKLLRSVRASSVSLVSTLSTRRLTWLLPFVCLLAVCSGQSVSGWLRILVNNEGCTTALWVAAGATRGALLRVERLLCFQTSWTVKVA